MIDLNQILQGAEGGQAIDNLATRFGLSPDQARSAVEALLPALQMGLQNRIGAGGLGSLLGQAAGQGGAEPGSPAAEQHGRSVLGDLFGHAGTTASVAQQAAAQSGVSAAIIQAMLPMIASLLMRELAAHAGGGLGGMLGGVLGSVFGQGAGGGGAPSSTGGLGGAIGDILGGFLGGGAHPTTPASSSPPPRTATPSAPMGPAPTIEEGAQDGSGNAMLDEISAMITAGTPPAPAHEAALADIVRR